MWAAVEHREATQDRLRCIVRRALRRLLRMRAVAAVEGHTSAAVVAEDPTAVGAVVIAEEGFGRAGSRVEDQKPHIC
jgi:hypothetical protein